MAHSPIGTERPQLRDGVLAVINGLSKLECKSDPYRAGADAKLAMNLEKRVESLPDGKAKERLMKLGIIGSGNIGRSIGSWAAKLGYEVTFSAKDEEHARQAAQASGHGARA